MNQQILSPIHIKKKYNFAIPNFYKQFLYILKINLY
jgi:hypothetical protein